MYNQRYAGHGGFAKRFKHAFHEHHPFMHGFRRAKYNVPINITEDDTKYEVHVFATGFTKSDIKITVTDDVLYITGSKTIAEENEPNFTRQEFPIKNFERVLFLNGKVDADNIAARHENAVLIVTLPKTPEAQTKEQVIEVL
ncbi:MAG: Hsp20/alpha crystallin family protein [Agriterribacter sp.]